MQAWGCEALGLASNRVSVRFLSLSFVIIRFRYFDREVREGRKIRPRGPDLALEPKWHFWLMTVVSILLTSPDLLIEIMDCDYYLIRYVVTY